MILESPIPAVEEPGGGGAGEAVDGGGEVGGGCRVPSAAHF